MGETKHSLTKAETERLTNLLSVAKIQEELLNSVTLSYKAFVIGEVFKRLGLKSELYPKCEVNLMTGELILKEEPEKMSDLPKTTELKKGDVLVK